MILTDEDRQWIREQMREQLEQNRRWMHEQLTENRQWMHEQLTENRQWMGEQRDEDRQWMREQLEALETKLPTEFHKWASPTEMRIRSHSATLRALDLELESVSERVKILEERNPNA